jgi:hypothetical protein
MSVARPGRVAAKLMERGILYGYGRKQPIQRDLTRTYVVTVLGSVIYDRDPEQERQRLSIRSPKGRRRLDLRWPL